MTAGPLVILVTAAVLMPDVSDAAAGRGQGAVALRLASDRQMQKGSRSNQIEIRQLRPVAGAADVTSVLRPQDKYG